MDSSDAQREVLSGARTLEDVRTFARRMRQESNTPPFVVAALDLVLENRIESLKALPLEEQDNARGLAEMIRDRLRREGAYSEELTRGEMVILLRTASEEIDRLRGENVYLRQQVQALREIVEQG
ncbi:MAG: hypothetical protein ABI718_02575 [Acidobacteriota bacterium]